MDSVELYEHNVGVWEWDKAKMPRTMVADYVESKAFQDFVKRLTVGAFQMGALGYRNAIVESQPTIPLEEADEKVSVVHVTSTELSTTLPVPQFPMEYDDWKWDVGLDTFESNPECEGGTRDEVEDVGEDDVDLELYLVSIIFLMMSLQF